MIITGADAPRSKPKGTSTIVSVDSQNQLDGTSEVVIEALPSQLPPVPLLLAAPDRGIDFVIKHTMIFIYFINIAGLDCIPFLIRY